MQIQFKLRRNIKIISPDGIKSITEGTGIYYVDYEKTTFSIVIIKY